jgi:hypothetical protein
MAIAKDNGTWKIQTANVGVETGSKSLTIVTRGGADGGHPKLNFEGLGLTPTMYNFGNIS